MSRLHHTTRRHKPRTAGTSARATAQQKQNPTTNPR
jgi:hypothetical protein